LVVGTSSENDLNSPQFWIDKEKLYLRRVIFTSEKHTDIHFYNYQVIHGFPVATTIRFTVDYELSMVEEYFSIAFPETVDDCFFDPDFFQFANWGTTSKIE